MGEKGSRDVTEVGRGDYVKIGQHWKKIEANTASGQVRTPKSWTVRTTDGAEYGMFQINRYAKAEDIEKDE